MRILVVDDDPDSVVTLTQGLDGVGTVSACESSLAARRLLGSDHADGIDLLLIDLRMDADLADIDVREGLELSHWCHRSAPAIPRLLISGETDTPSTRDVRLSGAIGLLRKPIDLRWLRAFVSQLEVFSSSR